MSDNSAWHEQSDGRPVSELPPFHMGRGRCTRIAKTTGVQCEAPRLGWNDDSPLPDPQSCFAHLTDAEREAHAANRAARRAWIHGTAVFTQEALMASDPACWSWQLPDDLDIAAAAIRDSLPPDVQEAVERGNGGDWKSSAMEAWHKGMCAICGRREARVTDHDHRTGLIRGLLCQSCNALEGYGPAEAAENGDVFAKYRLRNPASMWGVREFYIDPITGQEAAPAD